MVGESVLPGVGYRSPVTDPAPNIRGAFVAAYPEYVARVLTDRGIEIVPVIADSIVVGTGLLDGSLGSLERTPAGLQRHSPLELFREALRPVDNALDVAGIEMPSPDGPRGALRWDRYGLSPGSSKQLGVEAYEVHLRWGIWKARAHGVRPPAGLLCLEADAPILLEQLNALGYEVHKLPSAGEFVLGLIDISVAGADQVITDMASAGTRVVAFGADPDDIAQIRTKALGASVVLSRTELLDDLAGHLPTIV